MVRHPDIHQAQCLYQTFRDKAVCLAGCDFTGRVIVELLNMLDIKGKIITTDAMGCQKDIAEKIQKQGGDYLFAARSENYFKFPLVRPE